MTDFMTASMTKKLQGTAAFAAVASAVVASVLSLTQLVIVKPFVDAHGTVALTACVAVYYFVLATAWAFGTKKSLWDADAQPAYFLLMAALLPLAGLVYGVLSTNVDGGLAFLLNMAVMVPGTLIIGMLPYVPIRIISLVMRCIVSRKTV